ncbi:hypothetical protein FRC00_008044, partial [Tulasnella sp. 408]
MTTPPDPPSSPPPSQTNTKHQRHRAYKPSTRMSTGRSSRIRRAFSRASGSALRTDRRASGEQDYHPVADVPEVRGIDTLPAELSAVKLVEPVDAEAMAGGTTNVDFGVLEMKTTRQKLVDHISEIERQYRSTVASSVPFVPLKPVLITLCSLWFRHLDTIGEHLSRKQKHCAYGPSVEEAAREASSPQAPHAGTLQAMLRKIESAATEVEIKNVYNTPARTLRAVLQIPLLRQESIEATTTCMAAVLADHKEIEDASRFGNDLAASSAGVPDVDDEPKDELEMLIKERKKEEEAEK